MKTYPIPMVPGPVKVAQEVLDAYQINYGSSDLESEFFDLYNQTESNLKIIIFPTRPTGMVSPDSTPVRNLLLRKGCPTAFHGTMKMHESAAKK